ncbi:hypothetical protein EV385_1538 [Krasilnikovia cinnamomea]|uniref:Uncharacterized protein n=1 Tax=Krasilnikovia cinnamomea TaxID=349313 RepID=A0A4Q7ZH96_9ACTN|nr:hypothetical protein [Krasilnikovia cinnamomea]RZU49784.1 hypothetical protein EV385_1538 [Krasilnikovia cinnamomea]
MPEHDLDRGLAALARHAGHNGRLAPAADLRARADRRRKRRYAATGALGAVTAVALGVGIAAAQPHGAGPAPAPPAAPASPSRSAIPTPSSPAPSESTSRTATPPTSGKPSRQDPAVLAGKRQVFLFVLHKGEEVPESVVAVTSSGRVGVTADYGDRALFVPVPTAPSSSEHLIKTGKLTAGGEPYCLRVRGNGSDPLTVVTAACDTRDPAQRFTFAEHGRDNQGRMTYAIRNGDAYLQWNPTGTSGLIAEELGDGNLDTTFVLIDRGAATLPF